MVLNDARGVSLPYLELSLCLLPLHLYCYCAARTPRAPHAARALLPLVHRTHRAIARAAPALALHSPGWTCLWPPRAVLHTGARPPAQRAQRGRGACTRAGQPRAPACGRLERPCTRAPVPPARGACTRAGQRRRTTTERYRVSTRAQSRRRRSMGYGNTGPPPRQRGARLVPPMRAWLTPPHGRRHKAPPQPCALTT